MRRSALAVLLAALCASLLSFTAVPATGEPYTGPVSGRLFATPDEVFEGEKVKLTANFPSEKAGQDVTFYRESATTPDDYEQIGPSSDANSYGNAYLNDYQVDDAQQLFAKTTDGGVTPLFDIEPKEPGACTESGSFYVDPSFITEGQKIKLTANFASDQAGARVTFFRKIGTAEMEPIGTSDANSYGNAYFYDYEVEGEQVLSATSSKGMCTPTKTVTPTVIDPDNFTESGSISTTPTKVYDGRTASIVANFPNDQAGTNVTLFKAKEAGGWEAVGTARAGSTGNAYFNFEFDGSDTFFGLSDKGDGVRTPVREFTPAAPNDVNGGPGELGRNVIYVTTNSGRTPVTKGVDYKGKAVLTSNEVPTETFDLETIAVRGNSSADKAKKPYKLKFDSKQQPFGMKSDKTWILLANYGDWTLVRSMVAWDLGRMLDGLKWTPKSTFAELYINGKYLGSYQMVESVKIDKNRVPVSKTTGQVIEFDPHYREDGVPGMVGKTGVKYAWKDPDEFKTLDEGDCDVATNPDCEDPEGLTTAKINAMKDKIRKFENVLYGSTGNRNWATFQPSTAEDDWTTYLDMSSAVDYYLAREFAKDNDADMYRSNFFYTNNVDPGSADKFFMGPIWDFDRSAGAKNPSDTSVDQPTGWWMRGNGSPDHDTNKIHWYTRITDDPRFLKALHDRWATTKQHFEAVGPQGVSAAARKLGGDQAGLDELDVPGDPDYDLGKQVAANDRARWEGFGGRYDPRSSTYSGELSWVRNWYKDRYEWMDAQLSKPPPPLL